MRDRRWRGAGRPRLPRQRPSLNRSATSPGLLQAPLLSPPLLSVSYQAVLAHPPSHSSPETIHRAPPTRRTRSLMRSARYPPPSAARLLPPASCLVLPAPRHLRRTFWPRPAHHHLLPHQPRWMVPPPTRRAVTTTLFRVMRYLERRWAMARTPRRVTVTARFRRTDLVWSRLVAGGSTTHAPLPFLLP